MVLDRNAVRGPATGTGRKDAASKLVLVLAAGDAIVFLVFALLGRSEHHEASGLVAAVETAWPFLAGWLVVAPFRGAISADSVRGPKVAAKTVARAWLVAWPVALILRAAIQRRGIPVSFDFVALAANGVLLVTWRSMFAVLRGRASSVRYS